VSLDNVNVLVQLKFLHDRHITSTSSSSNSKYPVQDRHCKHPEWFC